MYQVGDTVYADFSRYSNIKVRAGTVVKVTPTERINVDFGEKYPDGSTKIVQFKNGHEVGRDRWHGAMIIERQRYDALLLKQQQRQAVSEFKTHCTRTNFEDKADILKFVEELNVLAHKIHDSWPKGV